MSIDMSQFYQLFFEETSEHLANMEGLLWMWRILPWKS